MCSVVKRQNKESIAATMKTYENMTGNKDSTTVVLSYDEMYLYAEINEQKYKFEFKKIIMRDVGAAYFTCLERRGNIDTASFFDIPKKAEDSSFGEGKYQDDLEKFINGIVPKMKRKKVIRWYQVENKWL